MKATVEQVNKYKITIGDTVYDNFKKQDEWEGIISFSDEKGRKVLVTECQTNFDDFIDKLLGEKAGWQVEVFVVKAHPDLLVGR